MTPPKVPPKQKVVSQLHEQRWFQKQGVDVTVKGIACSAKERFSDLVIRTPSYYFPSFTWIISEVVVSDRSPSFKISKIQSAKGQWPRSILFYCCRRISMISREHWTVSSDWVSAEEEDVQRTASFSLFSSTWDVLELVRSSMLNRIGRSFFSDTDASSTEVDTRMFGELVSISEALSRGEGTGESDMEYHSKSKSVISLLFSSWFSVSVSIRINWRWRMTHLVSTNRKRSVDLPWNNRLSRCNRSRLIAVVVDF